MQLTWPAPACQRTVKEQHGRHAAPSLVRARSLGWPCSKGSSTTFPRLAVWSTIFAAVVCWPTDAGSGFNSWEGQSRHRPRTRPRVLEAWRVASPFFLLGSATGRPLESWKMSGPLVSSHRVTVTSSQGTQLLSTRVLQTGQLVLRPRMKPRSLTNCCMPRRHWPLPVFRHP